MSMPKSVYHTGNHDVTYFFPDETLKNKYVDLKDIFDILNTDESKLKINMPQYGTLDYFPTKKFMLTYDPAKIGDAKGIPAKYLSRLDTIRFESRGRQSRRTTLLCWISWSQITGSVLCILF